MLEITWSDFEKVDMRIGRIIEVYEFPQARIPAYRIKVDLGHLGIKQSSAQITDKYKKEELLGKQVVCVVNFPVKQIGPVKSEVLIMGSYSQGGVIILTPDKEAKEGDKIG